MAITTRTQCLISPNNATAFTSLISNSTSSSTRKRTRILPSSSSTSGRRMTLFTLIYISLAVITLFLSPSACAGITLDLNANLTNGVFTKPAARLRRVELICTAKVPQTTLMWYRERTDKDRTSDWENMSEVCDKPDVEVTDRKKPPDHCKLISESGENSTILKLEIKRVRKEASEKFSTLSDFRKYKCEANKDTKVTIRLIERISIVRSFGHRGVLSLTVLQGDTLELYCDIYGVKDDDFKSSGRLTVVWKKDGEYFNPMSEAVSFNSPKVKLQEGLIKDPEKGNPYRHGFTFEMAEPEHRGMYTCELGKKEGSEGNYQTIDSLEYYVRVKDKLGALWPFLGICGEVVLLCTIILIYEKRKSKAELEESDTDGSPDQNNSNSND